ncbi:NmrA-like family protein-like protein [Phaeosphaeriaceae sp. PMI808]|nr:NmrA-like family protein-like protein [Phaeosphaeriaceae sp. PMI808]
MVKIAVAGGTGNVATEVLRPAIRSGKHQITIFTRSIPTKPTPGVTYHQTDYTDLPTLTQSLKGFDICLSFFVAHLDTNGTGQKNLIHACIDAGVKRFAPSEWCLASNSGVAQYAAKDSISAYLASLKESGALGSMEYCLFQPSVFLDYFAHPHPLSPDLITWPVVVDFEHRRAILMDEGDVPIVLTAIADIGEMVALAVEDEGVWPVVGGMTGVRTTIAEILALGKRVRGGEWQVEHVRSEDIQAGVLESSWVPRLEHPTIPEERKDELSRRFVIHFFAAMLNGSWEVGDEFNRRFPEYQFVGLEEYLTKAWEGKP